VPRVISSAQTFSSKFIIPVVVGGAALMALRNLGTSPVHYALLAFLGLVMYRYLGRLKKVTLDGNTLVISNYFSEARVPLKDVVEVTGSRWANTRQVTLTFDRDTAFGASIIFMPQARFLWPGQEHPIARELRELVQQAREGDFFERA
jgi:hypothetical protein